MCDYDIALKINPIESKELYSLNPKTQKGFNTWAYHEVLDECTKKIGKNSNPLINNT